MKITLIHAKGFNDYPFMLWKMDKLVAGIDRKRLKFYTRKCDGHSHQYAFEAKAFCYAICHDADAEEMAGKSRNLVVFECDKRDPETAAIIKAAEAKGVKVKSYKRPKETS